MFEHIADGVLSSSEALAAVTKLIDLQLAGEVPRDSFLSGATLIGTVKPDGGVRPLAIVDAWYRVAMLFALHAVCRELGVGLAPLNVGVGTPCGVKAIAHAVATAVAADTENAVLTDDMQNAFNTLDRSAMFQAVQEPPPACSLLSNGRTESRLLSMCWVHPRLHPKFSHSVGFAKEILLARFSFLLCYRSRCREHLLLSTKPTVLRTSTTSQFSADHPPSAV
jgi:hypothetical protein